MEQVIKDNWTRPGHPTAFAGLTTLKNYYRGRATPFMIRKALASLDPYTIKREAKPVKVFNPIYARYPRQLIQCDLIDIQNLAKWNDGVKYIMCAIDSLTRFLWVETMKTKSNTSSTEAYSNIFEKMGHVERLLVDRGKEWDNVRFKRFLEDNGTDLTFASGISGKAPTVERVQRSLQSLMYKYMEEEQTRRYVDVLQDLVNSYNSRKHRMIGMTPEEAETIERRADLMAAQHKKYAQVEEQRKQQVKAASALNIGDQVRILLERGKFARGYSDIFSREVFKISEIDKRLPVPMFTLEALDNQEPIIGRFYARELQIVDSKVFKIEKILKTKKRGRKTFYFVKWLGYGPQHNSWIDGNADIVRVYSNTE